MTDELTKTFFDTFGIKPKTIFKPIIDIPQFEVKSKSSFTEIKRQELKVYPQTKDRHFLELLGLVNAFGFANPIKLKAASYAGIKDEILELAIDLKHYYENHRLQKIAWMYQDFKKEVQSLFEEAK